MDETTRTKIGNLCKQGQEHLNSKEYYKALECFIDARSLNPNNYAVYILIGETRRRMGDAKGGLDDLCRAKERYELDIAAKGGKYSPEPGKTTEADFRKYPKIDYYLALCRIDLGETERAFNLMKSAANVLFTDLLEGDTELSDGPAKAYKDAEAYEAAGMFSDACSLLKPVVFQEILAVDNKAGSAASR